MPLSELIRNLLESHGGILPAASWPGGYPIMYYAEDMGQRTVDPVCAECANVAIQNQGKLSWTVWAYDPYMEGPTEQCANCHKDIASAYGDRCACSDCESHAPRSLAKCKACGDTYCSECRHGPDKDVCCQCYTE